jgi:hypothetical protein
MITIFYHQHSLNDYMERFNKTYSKIISSGLINRVENFFVISDDPDKKVKYDGRVKPIFHDNRFASEYITISRLKRNAQEKPGYTLYLHSKGVSHPTSENVQGWIDLMEYFLIEKWEQSVCSLIDGYEVAGVNYTEHPEKHFSGNFWWASNQYISTLPDVHPTDRLRCEMWVCQNNPKVNKLHNSPINHYHTRYPRNLYAIN